MPKSVSAGALFKKNKIKILICSAVLLSLRQNLMAFYRALCVCYLPPWTKFGGIFPYTFISWIRSCRCYIIRCSIKNIPKLKILLFFSTTCPLLTDSDFFGEVLGFSSLCYWVNVTHLLIPSCAVLCQRIIDSVLLQPAVQWSVLDCVGLIYMEIVVSQTYRHLPSACPAM